MWFGPCDEPDEGEMSRAKALRESPREMADWVEEVVLVDSPIDSVGALKVEVVPNEDPGWRKWEEVAEWGSS